MIRLTARGALNKAYDLIDNRLVLAMASHNIHRNPIGSKVTAFIEKRVIIHKVADMIFYAEKNPMRGSAIIDTSIMHGNKRETHRYGLALRERSDGLLDIYIDTYLKALERGILPRHAADKWKAGLGCLVAAAIFLVLAAALLTPAGWFAAGFVIVASPILVPLGYFRAKRRFKREQEIMRNILSAFESEFPVVDKLDTKDWLSLSMRVKSAVKDVVVP